MSYTNKTTHYELPQYVATDKPKYLTDFNETMATIDGQMYTNATAAATAQTAAEGAQSTADGAVSSIGTLNTQINGDPTEPSDTGLVGDVSELDGDVNTIQALLGNGTPTTSNQTVIGAINAIEASIAPAEDSAALGANYATGAQFARGGVVYEALTDLTSGTAFTSLTLNTDYKVADTLVKQINDVSGVVSDIGGLAVAHFNNSIEITADGVKTWGALLDDAVTDYLAAVDAAPDDFFQLSDIVTDGYFLTNSRHGVIKSGQTLTTNLHGTNIDTARSIIDVRDIDISSNTVSAYDRAVITISDSSISANDYLSNVPTSGKKLFLNYREYRPVK